MLLFAAALLLVQRPTVDKQHPMGTQLYAYALPERLVAYAKRKGWEETTNPDGNSKVAPWYVRVRLQGGMKAIDVLVEPEKSHHEAIRRLNTLRADVERGVRRTDIDEPALKNTGLLVDVVDFSNKRISNMKTYALTFGRMRVSGEINDAVVWITVDTPQAVVGKTEGEIYDDIVSFGKFLAEELKKK